MQSGTIKPQAAGKPLAAGAGLVLPATGSGPTNAGSRPLALAFMKYLNLTFQSYLSISHDLAGRLPSAQHEAFRRSVAVATRALGRNQKALLACFASPTIGTPLQTASLRDALADFTARIDAASATVVPHVLLEFALRRLIEGNEQIDFPGAPVLATLALGVEMTPPPGTTALRFASGRVDALEGAKVIGSIPLDPAAATEGEIGGFQVARKYHRVGKVTRLALLEHNPIAEFEAHPDKDGNHIGLGGHPVEEWIASLDESFGVVEKYCPEVFAEMAMMLHEVIPVGYHDERHLSCSYREAIGTIWVTLHPSLMTMAEALIHEFQHNKMNVAAYSAEFIENAFEPRYKSPVRPDPRPLWGILLAVHAFLPVALLYRRMRDAGHPRAAAPDFLRRMSEIDLKNHEGMEMLRAHAKWLPAGAAMFAELDALDRRHMGERAAAGLETKPTEVHLA